MNNYVDLLLPVANSGSVNRYEPLEWAKQHCPSYITNQAVDKHGEYYYRFYFGKEKDQIMFALRWL